MHKVLPIATLNCCKLQIPYSNKSDIDTQIILAWLMAYAVAAIVKKDGKPYVDMAAVNEAPAGTFFWVHLALALLNAHTLFDDYGPACNWAAEASHRESDLTMHGSCKISR